MTCDQRQDLILLYASDALEPAEQEEVRRHLAGGCPQCEGTLAEARAVLSQLPLSLDEQAAPPAAKQRLMARVSEDLAATNAGSTVTADAPPLRLTDAPPPPPRRSVSGAPRPIPWFLYVVPPALAAVLAVAVTLAALWPKLTARPVSPLAQGTNPAFDPQRMMVMIDQQSQLIHRLQNQLVSTTRPSDLVQFAELKSTAQPEARGRVIWDVSRNQWYVVAVGLKPLPPGKRYELWYIKGQTPIAAGMLDVDAQGMTWHQTTDVPPPGGDAITAALTDEPAAGVQQPTGSIQLAGQMQKG